MAKKVYIINMVATLIVMWPCVATASDEAQRHLDDAHFQENQWLKWDSLEQAREAGLDDYQETLHDYELLNSLDMLDEVYE